MVLKQSISKRTSQSMTTSLDYFDLFEREREESIDCKKKETESRLNSKIEELEMLFENEVLSMFASKSATQAVDSFNVLQDKGWRSVS